MTEINKADILKALENLQISIISIYKKTCLKGLR